MDIRWTAGRGLRTRRSVPSGLALFVVLMLAAACGPTGPGPTPPSGDVTVTIEVDGRGSVTVNGFACSGTCSVGVDGSTATTFEASPSSGQVLAAWGGVCAPLEAACTRVFADGDVVRATFAQDAIRLDLAGDGVGSVAIVGPGLDATCTTDCGLAADGRYQYGVTVTETARTVLGPWGGACEASGDDDFCLVTPSGATNVAKTWTHPPIANDDAYTVLHDRLATVPASTGVLDNDDDTTDDTLTAVLAPGGAPGNGTLDLAADGSFTYLPNAAYVGPDAFTYDVVDAFGSTSRATVILTVTNEPPTASADGPYSVGRADVLTVPAPGVVGNDSDPDGDALTAQLAPGGAPASGTLDLAPDGGFTYTPDGTFVGDVTFTYVATDGVGTSAPVTVTVQVTNAAPTAASDPVYTVGRGAELDVPAPGVLGNDSDPDGDALTAQLAPGGAPATGSLDLAADGGFAYTPDGTFVGDVTFTYVASDGVATSAPVTVTIQVTNAAPTAVGDAYAGLVGENLTVPAPGVLANDTDPDSDPLDAVVATLPANGSLTLAADGSFTYAPAGAFVGTDSFTYLATDGVADSAPATVTLTIADAPP